MTAARFTHDCDSCVFVGQHGDHDVWFCPRCDGGSLIARYGNEGSEYASTPLFCLRPEHIAFLKKNPDYSAGQTWLWALEQPEVKPHAVAAQEAADRAAAKEAADFEAIFSS